MPKREADTRAKIIQAATALIIEQGGSDRLTTRDIASRAGVGVGLVNYHFQTKEHLVALCVQGIIGDVIGRFEPMYKGLNMAPVDKLRFLAKSTATFLAKNPGISRTSITTDVLSASPNDNTSQTLAAYAPVVREVCGGKASDAEISILLHLFVSAVQLAFLRGGTFTLFSGFNYFDEGQRSEYIDHIVDVIFGKYM